MNNVVWIDIEASSVDPRISKIFEIAMIITADLESISSLNLVVHHPDPNRVPIEMSSWSRKVYAKNGLLGALRYGTMLPDVDAAFASFLKKNAVDGGFSVAGRDVTAMLELLKHNCPRTYELLNVDEGFDFDHVRQFLTQILDPELIRLSYLGRNADRAMTEVTDHLEEARYYNDLIQSHFSDGHS